MVNYWVYHVKKGHMEVSEVMGVRPNPKLDHFGIETTTVLGTFEESSEDLTWINHGNVVMTSRTGLAGNESRHGENMIFGMYIIKRWKIDGDSIIGGAYVYIYIYIWDHMNLYRTYMIYV